MFCFSPLVCLSLYSPPIIPQQMGSPEILILGEREHGERSYERCNRESF